MTRRFGRFLRQNTIAMLALFIALGGTTYAAVSLPANSVGAKQLKKNAVINKKIKANAVTGAKVKNDSLTGADVLESSLGTVPSATTATNATHATSATSATSAASAASATNADKLDNLDSTAFQKVPTTTQHFTIAATSLVDQDSAGRDTNFNGAANQFCTTTGGTDFFAPVHLPDGAKVTGMKMDYVDDAGSATSNGTAYITRFPLVGRGGSYNDLYSGSLANTVAAGAAATMTATVFNATAAGQPVDNSKWAYTIIGFPGAAGARYCAIDVSYTVAPGFAATEPSRVANQPVGIGSRASR